jgi:hypothetical protein
MLPMVEHAFVFSSRAEGSPLMAQDLWPLVLIAILFVGFGLLICAKWLAERRR